MIDVFLSYAREDRAMAEKIAHALGQEGMSVWWDHSIGTGEEFDRAIEQAIDQARCVVVLWTQYSADSSWVRAEAGEGSRRGILVPLLLEDVQVPLAFRRYQTADLSKWRGGGAPDLKRIVEDIRKIHDSGGDQEPDPEGESPTSEDHAGSPASGKSTDEEIDHQKIQKIWATVGLVAVYLNVNIFLKTQGSHLFLPGPVPTDTTSYAAAIYGTWVAGPLLLAFLLMTNYLIRRTPNSLSWDARFPVAFGIAFGSLHEMRLWYQRAVFFFGLVVPVYCQGHFIRKTLNGTVYEAGEAVIVGWKQHLFSTKYLWEGIASGNLLRLDHEVTFFPFLQPWLSVILFITLLLLLLRIIRTLVFIGRA